MEIFVNVTLIVLFFVVLGWSLTPAEKPKKKGKIIVKDWSSRKSAADADASVNYITDDVSSGQIFWDFSDTWSTPHHDSSCHDSTTHSHDCSSDFGGHH